ncbi:F-box family protein [Dorcoceras hygrometricum]|nr:F-box family protein [Dorcoceras hygrometricum]
MSDPIREREKYDSKKAKTGESEDGPSDFHSPCDLYDAFGHIPGVAIEDFAENVRHGEATQEEELDPLVIFGSGIMMMMILSKLDARSVARSRLVSRQWLKLASSDIIWAPKCDELWLGKAHIPHILKAPGLSKLSAYSLSLMDSKRTRITRNDLCDHVWQFHFTECMRQYPMELFHHGHLEMMAYLEAPSYWRNLDPYWRGTGTLMRRFFHPDGSITADPCDPVWGGHESCYTVVTGSHDDGRIREHYVRVNKWPQMSVSRKEDWSWELSNHLGCYTSFPDADKHHGTGLPLLSSHLIN